MNNYNKLKHTTWECKYHLVWIPKYRKKMIYGQLRKYLGEILKELALQRESKIIEGHLMNKEKNICFQMMEANDPELFYAWFEKWNDLVDFELYPID